MTDSAMEEIYGLVYEAFRGGAGRDSVTSVSLPYDSPENLARHAEDPNAPFWGRCLRSGTMHSRWRDFRRRS